MTDEGGVNGTNRSATQQTGEPDHAGVSCQNSVWYELTPSQDGFLVLDTAGSAFDTVLGVYTNDSLGTLVQRASNNNYAGTSSRVRLRVSKGETYRIALDGASGASGRFKISYDLQTPANDGFLLAQTLSGTEGSVAGSNVGATTETAEPPLHECGSSWYSWSHTASPWRSRMATM